jgi:hypothetical protein
LTNHEGKELKVKEMNKIRCKNCGNPDAFIGESCQSQLDPTDEARCRWITYDLPHLAFTLEITYDVSDLSKEQKESLDDHYFPELQARSDYDFQSSLLNPDNVELMLRRSETGTFPIECSDYRNQEHTHIAYDFDGDDESELYIIVYIEEYVVCFPDDMYEWFPKDVAREVLNNSSIELKFEDRTFKPISVSF